MEYDNQFLETPMNDLNIGNYVRKSELPILPIIEAMMPWEAVSKIETVIDLLMNKIDLSDYIVTNDQAVHKSAIVEGTAQLKGPILIGPSCFIANGSLLRGGVILDANCIVGHCGELKTSVMFSGSKLAHLNFVGDSIIGDGANIEGGAIIANYRNELNDKEIIVWHRGKPISTGVTKFGAILGSDSRIGANATLAPGCIVSNGEVVKRGSLIDQCDRK